MKDWCTLVPDKWKDYDMSGCCMLHDGDYETLRIRWEADLEFYYCLLQVSTSKIAFIYYLGVRIFGWIFWIKRWACLKVVGSLSRFQSVPSGDGSKGEERNED